MKLPIVYEIAKIIEFNASQESDAVKYYSEFLEFVAKSELDTEDKEHIASEVEEIIADELNHQERLHQLCSDLTGIKANKD